MYALQSLIPARFLVMMSHLVFIITLFWSVDQVVRTCLPVDYSSSEFDNVRIELIIALSITLFFFLVEIIGFAAGFSMFNSTQSLFSIAAHAGATVALSYYAWESFDCRSYWYIFSFCSVLPAVTEIGVVISVLWLKKTV